MVCGVSALTVVPLKVIVVPLFSFVKSSIVAAGTTKPLSTISVQDFTADATSAKRVTMQASAFVISDAKPLLSRPFFEGVLGRFSVEVSMQSDNKKTTKQASVRRLGPNRHEKLSQD